jgi:hypothetical protein
MDRYWIYVYEVLPKSELNGEWYHMKDKQVSFIKREYR